MGQNMDSLIDNSEIPAERRKKPTLHRFFTYPKLRIPQTANVVSDKRLDANEVRVPIATLEAKAAFKQQKVPWLKEEDATEKPLLNEEDTSEFEAPLLNKEDISEEDKDDSGGEEENNYSGEEEEKEDVGKEEPLEDNQDDNGKEDKVDDGKEKQLEEKEVPNSKFSCVSPFGVKELLEGNKDNGQGEDKNDGKQELLEEREAQNRNISSCFSCPSEIKVLLEENKDDNGKKKDKDDVGKEAQNSKVSSLSPPSEIERNKGNFNTIPFVRAEESDHARLLNPGKQSSSLFSANGAGEGNFLAGENEEQGGVLHEPRHDPGNNHHVPEETSTSANLVGCFDTVTVILFAPGSKAFLLKWAIIVLNVVIEICQATLAQEAAQGKMPNKIYLTLSIITSSVCLLMSLIDAYLKAKSSGVECRRMGCFWWFYSQGRLFGTFMLYFGIICSMVQLVVNFIAKLINRDFIKFDYVPLLLAVCHFVATVIASKSSAVIKCKTHGYFRVEPTTVVGYDGPVYECLQCQREIPV